MTYEVYTRPSFDEEANGLTKEIKERVNNTITEKLMVDPYRGAGNEGHLEGKYLGLRRIRIGRAGYRIFFSICEECRKLNYDKHLMCIDCAEMDDETVMLFNVKSRPKAYD